MEGGSPQLRVARGDLSCCHGNVSQRWMRCRTSQVRRCLVDVSFEMSRNGFITSLFCSDIRCELATHLEQCPRCGVPCKFCSSIFPFNGLENHLRICPSTKTDLTGEDSQTWKTGRGCPFGCQGQWTTAKSLEAHAREFLLRHLEDVNGRVVNLEKTLVGDITALSQPKSTLQQQLLNCSPQQTSSRDNSEMEDMDGTGPGPSQPIVAIETLQRPVNAAGMKRALIAGGSSPRLEAEIQQIFQRLLTLESNWQFVQSDTAPSPSSSNVSLSRQLDHPRSAGFVFATRPSSSSSSPPQSNVVLTENTSATALRKLELCYRKAETYEGMAMVLNVSFDRLLNQVTEIDNQRRSEIETRDAQERKIQVSFFPQIRKNTHSKDHPYLQPK